MSEYKELTGIITETGFELDFITTTEKQRDYLDLYDIYLKDSSHALFILGLMNDCESQSLNFLHQVSNTFIDKLSKTPEIEELRYKAYIDISEAEIDNLILKVPFITGSEYLSHEWFKGIFKALNEFFSKSIKSYNGTVSQFLKSFNKDIEVIGRVYFHLVESKKDYPFAFLSTYSIVKEGKTVHLPLKNALIEYKSDNGKLLELLSTVNRASEKSSFIKGLVESGEIFHPIGLYQDEAYLFLKEVPLYQESGILCRIPNWWKKKDSSVKLSINIGKSYLSQDELLDYDISLMLGDEQISIDEIRALLAQTEGLALIKGKWIEVNREKLEEALKAYEKAQEMLTTTDIDLVSALRMQLNAKKALNLKGEEIDIEVNNGTMVKEIISKLVNPKLIDSIDCGKDFHANLRKYQSEGLNWLYYLKTVGLGACLADDMGLGKTIQVIALLNYLNTVSIVQSLIVVPASLIGNWQSEIKKFAPSLKYSIIHPNAKAMGDNSEEESDIYITTYGMLNKYEWVKEKTWDLLILDEAQAIKNPNTIQTKTVKQLKATFRLALTGTPIENRLSDLWSLFDFINKGLLGNKKEFKDFTSRIKEESDGYLRLRQVISPFILRRLKTNKEIISDLPDKIEMKTYATLSKKQVALYTDLVKEIKHKLEESDGIERKGLVLSSLLKFKQICNHPDQYLGQSTYLDTESGKFERLKEICETILEKRERLLIFTQFKEICEPLQSFLEGVFMHKGLVLHGEIPVSKRKAIVDKFQGKDYVPFMVLSIKAGGVGLNLTEANHVVHFDRWWNPAVENQATDRAFRIGQMKNVIVHKFITKGTIEEKIDSMIEDKLKLSNDVISDVNENILTEMSNDELLKLFTITDEVI